MIKDSVTAAAGLLSAVASLIVVSSSSLFSNLGTLARISFLPPRVGIFLSGEFSIVGIFLSGKSPTVGIFRSGEESTIFGFAFCFS